MLRPALALLLTAAPVMAAEITDHAGFSVQVPDAPQRIVSMHDWVTTVMLAELDAPMAGSVARLRDDGSFYMRSAEELFGRTTENTPLASVHGQADPERVASLTPDLIIANSGDYLQMREQLASIAPTIIMDPENGMPPFEIYRQFAGWIGKTAAFDALNATFADEAAKVANGRDLSACTYLPLLVNDRDGTLTVASDYGGVSLAMDALGMEPADSTALIPDGQARAIVSAEIAGSLTADVLVLTYLGSRGETADSTVAEFDTVVPGFLDYMAGQGTVILNMARERVYPTSFKGATEVLAALDAQPFCE